jgi:hypothetical protein
MPHETWDDINDGRDGLNGGLGRGNGHGCNDKLNIQIDYKINDCL